jgi:hypothetical protein
MSHQLPIFNPLPVNEELLESYHVECLPLAELDKGPIEFVITGDDDFIDFSATTLYLQAKITKADGSAYPADTSSAKQEVAFKNNSMHSLFSDVLVKFNSTLVEGGEGCYALKSYINTLFSFSDTTMEKQLFASGFAKDDAGAADAVTNKGYITRKAWTVAGAKKEFYGKLHVDAFLQPRLMVPNVNTHIKLIKASYEQAIWTNASGEKPRFSITEAKLFVKKVKAHPLIEEKILSTIERGGILHYPINRVDINTITVAPGIKELCKEPPFYGKVPKILVMGMLNSEAALGTYGKNPFNFQHHGIKEVDLRINGTSKPTLPFKPDFEGKLYLREYMALLEAMNILGKDTHLPITYEDFASGYTFFAWNLTADYAAEPQNPNKRANIRLDVQWAKDTVGVNEIILYAIYDSTILIDGDGKVFTDYKD